MTDDCYNPFDQHVQFGGGLFNNEPVMVGTWGTFKQLVEGIPLAFSLFVL